MKGYRSVVHWRPMPDPHPADPGHTHQPEPTVHTFDTLAEAEQDGAAFGCLAGTTRIEVLSPDGTLQALWDKESTEVVLSDPLYPDYDRDGNGIGEPVYDRSHVSNRWQRLGEESVALGKAQLAETTARLRAEGRLPHRGEVAARPDTDQP